MKNWFFSLFGGNAESTPSPQPATAVYSATDRKLDLIWSRYVQLVFSPEVWRHCFQTLPPLPPFRREDHPDPTSTWPAMLDQHRFLLVRFPPRYKRDENNVCRRDDKKLMRYPLRSEVQDAGGFERYCLSEAFAATIRKEVEDWQLAALLWNREQQPHGPFHDEEDILLPPIDVHLLDPEGGGPVKMRLPRWPYPPPSLPPLAPAKPTPTQQPPHGIAQVMLGSKDKVKKPRTR